MLYRVVEAFTVEISDMGDNVVIKKGTIWDCNGRYGFATCYNDSSYAGQIDIDEDTIEMGLVEEVEGQLS